VSEENQVKFSISGSDHLIIHRGKPEIQYEKYISFERGGVEEGFVTATFDLSGLPPEHHQLFMQCLQPTRIMLPIRQREERKEELPSSSAKAIAEPPQRSWFRKLLGRLV
jgi:hypothetical protein